MGRPSSLEGPGRRVEQVRDRSGPAVTLTPYSHVYDGLDKEAADPLDRAIADRAVGFSRV
jgi:hypothetical protein